MNFFSLFSRKPPQKKGKIKDYSAVTTKTFDSYKTATGDVSVDYDLVENLYKRTIMRRIINKLAGDATKLGFKFKYYDETGKEIGRASCRERVEKSEVAVTLRKKRKSEKTPMKSGCRI